MWPGVGYACLRYLVVERNVIAVIMHRHPLLGVDPFSSPTSDLPSFPRET